MYTKSLKTHLPSIWYGFFGKSYFVAYSKVISITLPLLSYPIHSGCLDAYRKHEGFGFVRNVSTITIILS
jgi:hypothetical protein